MNKLVKDVVVYSRRQNLKKDDKRPNYVICIYEDNSAEVIYEFDPTKQTVKLGALMSQFKLRDEYCTKQAVLKKLFESNMITSIEPRW